MMNANDNDGDEDPVFAVGFEAALIGIGRKFNINLAVYDYNKCVEILMERDEMSVEEAVEFMEYNVVGAYVGPQTPVFVEPKEEEED